MGEIMKIPEYIFERDSIMHPNVDANNGVQYVDGVDALVASKFNNRFGKSDQWADELSKSVLKCRQMIQTNKSFLHEVKTNANLFAIPFPFHWREIRADDPPDVYQWWTNTFIVERNHQTFVKSDSKDLLAPSVIFYDAMDVSNPLFTILSGHSNLEGYKQDLTARKRYYRLGHDGAEVPNDTAVSHVSITQKEETGVYIRFYDHNQATHQFEMKFLFNDGHSSYVILKILNTNAYSCEYSIWNGTGMTTGSATLSSPRSQGFHSVSLKFSDSPVIVLYSEYVYQDRGLIVQFDSASPLFVDNVFPLNLNEIQFSAIDPSITAGYTDIYDISVSYRYKFVAGVQGAGGVRVYIVYVDSNGEFANVYQDHAWIDDYYYVYPEPTLPEGSTKLVKIFSITTNEIMEGDGYLGDPDASQWNMKIIYGEEFYNKHVNFKEIVLSGIMTHDNGKVNNESSPIMQRNWTLDNLGRGMILSLIYDQDGILIFRIPPREWDGNNDTLKKIVFIYNQAGWVNYMQNGKSKYFPETALDRVRDGDLTIVCAAVSNPVVLQLGGTFRSNIHFIGAGGGEINGDITIDQGGNVRFTRIGFNNGLITLTNCSYIDFNDCKFGQGKNIATDSYQAITMSGASFVKFIGCTYYSYYDFVRMYKFIYATGCSEIDLIGCNIYCHSGEDVFPHVQELILIESSTHITIHGCHFRIEVNGGPSTITTTTINLTNSTVIIINDNVLYMSGDAGYLHSIKLIGGTIATINGNVFNGNTTSIILIDATTRVMFLGNSAPAGTTVSVINAATVKPTVLADFNWLV